MGKSSSLSKESVSSRAWEKISLPTLFWVVFVGLAGLIGSLFGLFGFYVCIACIGALSIIIIFLFRQDELIAALLIALHLIVDWYLAMRVIALVLALIILCIFFIMKSAEHPWVQPRALWLWGGFLLLSVIPAVRGGSNLYDILYYYPNIVVGALLMFWLGTTLARNIASIRLLFNLLAVFGVLIAIHTIIQAKTGVFLFSWSHIDDFIANRENYHLPGSPDIARPGSFFIDPDWSSAFFAMTIFIPLGLFIECSKLFTKVVYLLEVCVIAIALLFTYSTGAVSAAIVGAIVFIALMGSIRHRIQLLICISVVLAIVLVGFPSDINLLSQHSVDSANLILRLGAWKTAINVIEAFPLTGVGLGQYKYLAYASSYRVPEQFIPLAQPHDSYLEFGAMAGIPVMIIFVALILFALWAALHNWLLSEVRTRYSLAGGIAAVVALSVNSISINAWTLPPLSAMGWLILGILSSPLFLKGKDNQTINKGNL